MKISTEGTVLVCVHFLSTPLFQGEIGGEKIELNQQGMEEIEQHGGMGGTTFFFLLVNTVRTS